MDSVLNVSAIEISAVDRRRAVAIVAAQDPPLGDRLDEALTAPQDPVVAAIRDLGVEMRIELRATRMWAIGLVGIALALNSALVGVSMGVQSGVFSLSTSAVAAPP